MKGLKNYKGNREIINNDFSQVKDSNLLVQELQNFLNIDEGDCIWDLRHGLSRKVLLSHNDEAIKSEIINKIFEFYGDRVLEIKNVKIIRENEDISFKAEIITIYGINYEVGGKR